MSRIMARDCGLKMVFQYLFNKQIETEKPIVFQCLFDIDQDEFEKSIYAYNLTDEEKDFYVTSFSTIKNNLFTEYDLTDEEKEFSLSIFSAVKNNYEELEIKVNSNLKNNLKVKDIYKLDYAILLVAIATIDYLSESISLAINEAVVMAKKYSTDKSPSFVNGVLSSIYKQK